MVDIEKKSLEYLRNNLNSLASSLANDKKIANEVINRQENINNWSITDRILLYIDIAIEILKKYDISKIVEELCDLYNKIELTKNPELKLVYSAIKRFYDFLRKVYEIYMLDQIQFILSANFNFENNNLKRHITTNSYYESISFGLSFFQKTFYGEEEPFINELYFIKETLFQSISAQGQERIASLNEMLSTFAFDPKNDNYYLAQMYIMLNSIPKKTTRRVRTKKEYDPNQTSLFE